MNSTHYRPMNACSPYLVWQLALCAIFVAAGLAAPPQATAQSFRIDSQVYDAATSQLIAEGLTLFDSGLVFDFALDLAANKQVLETVIYDTRQKSFVLLDHQRQVKLTLEDYELVRMLEESRRELTQQEQLAFLATPQLTEQPDLASQTVELGNQHFTYRVRGERPRDETMLLPYFEYLDKYARLSVSDPRRLPPFTRLEVNQTLRKLGWIPLEVDLWIHSDVLPRHDVHWTSKHHTTWTISDSDKARIEAVKKDWVNFKPVTLRKYRNLQAAPVVTSPAELAETASENSDGGR